MDCCQCHVWPYQSCSCRAVDNLSYCCALSEQSLNNWKFLLHTFSSFRFRLLPPLSFPFLPIFLPFITVLPSFPFFFLHLPPLRSRSPQIQLWGLRERCKHDQLGLRPSPSQNRIWCILALTAGGNSCKNATAHKVNSHYTLDISYCTSCVGNTILAPVSVRIKRKEAEREQMQQQQWVVL